LTSVPKSFREVEFEGDVQIGQKISLGEVFRKGSLVDVVGISKGKGFAGVVKRWGFAGGPRTHGQSDRERAPGSIGATTTPGRVYKGLKMAGHLGNSRVTVQGLEITEINEEENKLWVKGSVPGARGTLLLIQKSIKKEKAYHEPEIPAIPVVAGAKEEVAEETEATPPESLAPQPEDQVKPLDEGSIKEQK
jgi:ribosomal protein L3